MRYYHMPQPDPLAEFASSRTRQILGERDRACSAACQELGHLLEQCAAVERTLSDAVMVYTEIAALRAALCLERGMLEKEGRDAKTATKKLAGQLRRMEAREAEKRQAQSRSEAQARKEQAKLEALAQDRKEQAMLKALAARARAAIRSGVLPGHDDPETRRLCAIALVEAKRKERERARRAEALMTLALTKVFVRGYHELLNFSFTSFTGFSTGLLVRFYLEERIGTNGFRIQLHPPTGQFRLTCFLDADKKAPFSSPFAGLEDIAAWLDRQDFVDACIDLFGYDVEGPCIAKNARDIYDLFQSIQDEWVFDAISLRETDQVDCFNLSAFEITVLDTRGRPLHMRCSTIQLVVWYALGKLHALARTHERAYPAVPPLSLEASLHLQVAGDPPP